MNVWSLLVVSFVTFVAEFEGKRYLKLVDKVNKKTIKLVRDYNEARPAGQSFNRRLKYRSFVFNYEDSRRRFNDSSKWIYYIFELKKYFSKNLKIFNFSKSILHNLIGIQMGQTWAIEMTASILIRASFLTSYLKIISVNFDFAATNKIETYDHTANE